AYSLALRGHDCYLELLSLPTRRSSDLMVGLVVATMLIIWLFPKITKAIPSSLVAIIVVSGIVVLFGIPTTAVADTLAPGETIKGDRKCTRLNSSHVKISYAVFYLKKKK